MDTNNNIPQQRNGGRQNTRKFEPRPRVEYDHRVRLCDDGKYHWVYQLHLLKNPAVLIDVYWVLGVTMVIFACIFFLIQACDSGLALENFSFVFEVVGIMTAIFFVLGLLGYLLYAALAGWKYTVHFTLDEKGVVHEQTKESAKVGKRIGCLAMLVGLLAKKPGVVGTGMLAASRTTMTSDFASVSKVKPVRWMDTIKVREGLEKNRVYVGPEDYDFVLQYITSHCPNLRKA